MIKFFTGPMYSGKSSALIETLLKDYSQDFYKYLFIMPEADDRGFITHNSSLEKRLNNARHNIEYESINSFASLLHLNLSDYRVIFIDEIHLYESEGAYQFFKKVLESGVKTFVAGISGSSEQEPFATTSIFFPFASDVEFMHAKCYKDDTGEEHDKASYSKWVSSKHKKHLVHVGDSDYVASCGKCLNH